VLTALRATKPSHWRDAASWLYYTVGIGCVAFWGPIMLMDLLSRKVELMQLIGHGELVVYSAGLIAPAIPLILKDWKGSPYSQPKWFLGIIVLHLLTAVLVFASSTIASAFPALINLDSAALRTYSYWLVSVAVLIGFLTTLFDNLRADPNVAAIKQAQEDDLRKKFEASRDKSDG
jgi:hypothetical protein